MYSLLRVSLYLYTCFILRFNTIIPVFCYFTEDWGPKRTDSKNVISYNRVMSCGKNSISEFVNVQDIPPNMTLEGRL